MKNYVAIGDLVLDIYHIQNLGTIGYYAGGSAWNDLMNISSLNSNANCFCIGICGNDLAGDFVIQVLNENNINTDNVKRVNYQTKRYNIIISSEKTCSQLECPICHESIWYSNSIVPKVIPNYFDSISGGIVIVDSLKKQTIKLAKTFIEQGWFSAIDIGHIGHIRYMNADDIKSLICNNFCLIQMPDLVFRFLSKKLSCENEKELFNRLKCRYLNITNGEYGSKFIFINSYGEVEVINRNIVQNNAVDPTGAGDAYFSMLLEKLDNSGNFQNPIEDVLYQAEVFASERVSEIGATGRYKLIDMGFDYCKACGCILKKEKIVKKPRQRIAVNTEHLLDRILYALESDAIIALKNIFDSLQGQILMVGTGGSYAAAVFAAKCVSTYNPNIIAYSYHPRDVSIIGLDKVAAVILFSYSGRTKDIENIYRTCKKKGVLVYIVTKYNNENGTGIYDEKSIISYNSSKQSTKERGFISMAGTLIPMSLFGELYYSKSTYSDCFIDFLKDCFESRSKEFINADFLYELPKEKLNIDILSGMDTNCSAVDIESKFVESGLARVIIHEKKDFSHGRFNILEKYAPDLIISLDNYYGSYSQKLFQYIEKRKNTIICHLSTDKGYIWGDFDLVVASEFFAKYLSKALAYDMAKPDYPEDAMVLYNYSHSDLL